MMIDDDFSTENCLLWRFFYKEIITENISISIFFIRPFIPEMSHMDLKISTGFTSTSCMLHLLLCFFLNFLFYKILFCVVFCCWVRVNVLWIIYLFVWNKKYILKNADYCLLFSNLRCCCCGTFMHSAPYPLLFQLCRFPRVLFRYKIWFPFPLLILLPLLKIVTNSIYTKPCPLCVSNFFTISWGDHHYGYRISFNTVWHAADTFHFGHTLFVRIVKTFFTKGSTWWYGF